MRLHAARRAARLGPARQFVGIVVEPVGHAPIRGERPRPAFRLVGERLQSLGDESGHGTLVGLEVDRAVGQQGEHGAFGIEAGPAEQAADHDRPEGREQLADGFAVHRAARSGYPCASAEGLSCTDSPQPQAEV